MNCVRCHAPLEAGASFCRNCGLPVTSSQLPQGQIRLSPPLQQPQNLPPSGQSLAPTSQYYPPDVSQAQGSFPPAYQQQNEVYTGANMPPTAATTAPRRRRRRGGCLAVCLTTLILLVLIVGGLWFLVLRPYAHDTAIKQMDNAMAAAVNQIPTAQETHIPPGATLPVRQLVLNNLLVLNIAPSGPVQNTNMQITPAGVRLDFTLYGQLCTITTVPQAQNGKLVATHVTVSGIVGLVVSPDDITALLNRHLADAQARLNHPITGIRLMEQEMDLTLG